MLACCVTPRTSALEPRCFLDLAVSRPRRISSVASDSCCSAPDGSINMQRQTFPTASFRISVAESASLLTLSPSLLPSPARSSDQSSSLRRPQRHTGPDLTALFSHRVLDALHGALNVALPLTRSQRSQHAARSFCTIALLYALHRFSPRVWTPRTGHVSVGRPDAEVALPSKLSSRCSPLNDECYADRSASNIEPVG